MADLHLIMPMGGKGSRFTGRFSMPKPLIEIHGKPFFFWSVQSIARFIDVADITFVVLREHVDEFAIDRAIRRFYPDAAVRVIPEVLNGAVLTGLEGVREIRDDAPLVLNDCDHMFRSDAFARFARSEKRADGALLTFPSSEPVYSFVRFDGAGKVVGTVEKQAVSAAAICGCYYFGSRAVYEDAAEKYLQACDYKEFFISGLYNVMARENKKILSFPVDFHIPFGIPEEYDQALSSPRFEEME